MSTPRPGGRPFLLVFAYPDGSLPNPWFRAYKRSKRAMRRAGYDAVIEALPISDLPPEVDLLVAPPDLADEAQGVVGARRSLVLPAEQLQPELDRLIDRLVAQGSLQYAAGQSRSLATHRGFQPLRDRARVAD